MLSRRRHARERMLGLICAFWKSQLVFVAAKLGIADVLATGPLTADEIAQRVGCDGPHLQRVLRALASLGVFAADRAGRYRLTPIAATLRSDQEESLRGLAMMLVDDHNWAAWGALEHGVANGESAFAHVHGVTLFSYLQRHPLKELAFSQAMASLSALENAAIAHAYSFGRVQRLVDVGGAHGHLLGAVLRRCPAMHGVLFDQPQIIAAAAAAQFTNAPDLQGRCSVIGGDFFESVPAGADAYLLKYIIHDWNDGECIRILANCRKAMASGGRVLVIEHVLTAGNRRDWAKLLDVNMMVVLRGRERSRQEFRDLFARAGLRLQRVIRTAAPVTILEGRAP